jgi:hypothetical protein
MLVCRRHGRSLFQVDGRGTFRCLKCRGEAVIRRRRRVKELLVKEAGGACEICGYDRYLGALQFHHRDPAEKSFGLSEGGFTKSLEKLRLEARKCVLLCSNCHAETEGGIVELPLVSCKKMPGSSMAERHAVNVMVVGSSPTPAVAVPHSAAARSRVLG